MSQEMKVTDAKDVVLGSNNDNQTDLEHAPQPRAQSGFQTKGVLKDIDRDGDGFITREEVERFIGEHRVLTSEKKFFKYGFAFMVVMMIVFSFVIAGLTWGVIILTKETTVEDDVMVSSDTGDPIQCANTDLYVHNGVLLARSPSNGDNGRRGRRLTTGFEEDDILNDDTEAALGVRNVFKKRALSSMMPDQYFKELEWLEIESQSGSFLSLRVLSVIRIPSSNALCGTYLKLGTLHGTILLDEFNLYYDDDVNGIFLQSGLIDYYTGKTAHRRQLSSINHGTMRRLSEDFSLVGFFNAIDDAEWTCQSVRKPRMPSEYSATFTVLNQCDIGEEAPNQCHVEVPQSPVPIPGYGLTTVDGTEYYSRTRQAYVTPEYSALVDTFPHFPDMTFVTKSFPTGVTRMYQFDVEGSLSRCYEFQNMPLRMSLPDEYLLYPLGDIGNNLYRYRLSYMGIKGHISDGEEWIHIDYFEDNTTFMPKALIADENILQVDSMLTGDNMEYFSSSGFDVSDDDFAWCSIATKVVESDRYEAYINGEFEIPENVTLFEKQQYKDEEASWEWKSKLYPPIYASPASMGSGHLFYFAQFHTSYNESTEEFIGLNEFGEWVAAILNTEHEEILIEAEKVDEMNPNGTFYVPYSFDTGFDQNFTFSNFTFNFTNIGNITWVNGTEPLDRRALRSHASGSMRRQLGVKFSVDPFAPSIDISIEKYAIMYELGLYNGDMSHTISLQGEGCFLEVFCMIGQIYAVIKEGSANKNDYGGSVTLEMDFKAMVFEVVKIRYNYYGGNYNYGGYTLSKGTHVAAVERTLTYLEQARGTIGVEFTMAKMKVKKNDPSWVRYNAGSVQLYLKAEYFDGIAGFVGTWKTFKSYNYPISSWGTPNTKAIYCMKDAFIDLPVDTWLPTDWSAGIGNVIANMTSSGNFEIQLNADGKKEVLWKMERRFIEKPQSYFARLVYHEKYKIISFGIYRKHSYLMKMVTPMYLEMPNDASVCKYTISDYCVTSKGQLVEWPSPIDEIADFKGKIRWRLYGDGNLKIEYLVVREAVGHVRKKLPNGFGSYSIDVLTYAQKWVVAWESGVHGSCA
jgi:hypothetical protein